MQRSKQKSTILITFFIVLALIFSSTAWANEISVPSSMTTVTATSEKTFEKADYVIDGDLSTNWKSNGELPQSITLELSRPVLITELQYTPKAGQGVIEKYEVSVSKDGETFEKVAEGSWDEGIQDTQTVSIPSEDPVIAVQLTALSSSDNTAAAAEIALSTSDSEVVDAYVNLLQAIEEGQAVLRQTRIGNGADQVSEQKAILEKAVHETITFSENNRNTPDQDAEQTNTLNAAIQQFHSATRSIHLDFLNETIHQANQIEASGEYVEIISASINDALQIVGDENATIDQIDAAISNLVNVSIEADPNRKWIGSWATAMHAPFGGNSEGFNDRTIRQIIYPTASGDHARIRFSNVFGDRSLTLDKVTVALADSGAATVPGSHREVTFGGSTSVTIPAGQEVWSDPISFEVTDEVPLAISTYVSKPTGPTTWHMRSLQTTYIAPNGDSTENTDGAPYRLEQDSWYWISGLEVSTDDPNARVIVALGDSITDGAGSTVNMNNRWPNHLNRLLNETYPDAVISVLNAGISGNRVLVDSNNQGESALNRLHRDVFSHAGVTDIILLEGINDIGNMNDLTAEQLIDGYKKIIDEAHRRNIRVIGATLTPFRGFDDSYFSEEKELKRLAVNEWIRTTDLFDGVIDFDRMIDDPNNPGVMLADYDSGDHLHPGDEGYIVMGSSIDPALFDPNAKYEAPAEKPEQPVEPEAPVEDPVEPPVDEPIDEPADSNEPDEEEPAVNEPNEETPVENEPETTPGLNEDNEVPNMPKTGMGGTSNHQTGSWIVALIAIVMAAFTGRWIIHRRNA